MTRAHVRATAVARRVEPGWIAVLLLTLLCAAGLAAILQLARRDPWRQVGAAEPRWMIVRRAEAARPAQPVVVRSPGGSGAQSSTAASAFHSSRGTSAGFSRST